MKNNIISILLFFIVLGFIIFANSKLVSMLDKITYTCDYIETAIENEQYDLAYTSALNLLSLLETDNFIDSVYTSHSDLDLILNQSVSIAVSIQNGEYAIALDTLHILKFSTISLKKLQKINFENIF